MEAKLEVPVAKKDLQSIYDTRSLSAGYIVGYGGGSREGAHPPFGGGGEWKNEEKRR